MVCCCFTFVGCFSAAYLGFTGVINCELWRSSTPRTYTACMCVSLWRYRPCCVVHDVIHTAHVCWFERHRMGYVWHWTAGHAEKRAINQYISRYQCTNWCMKKFQRVSSPDLMCTGLCVLQSRPVECAGTQVLVVGLDGSGKSSLEQDMQPTQGFNAVSMNGEDLHWSFSFYLTWWKESQSSYFSVCLRTPPTSGLHSSICAIVKL